MSYQNENNTNFFFQEFKRHVIENTTILGKLGVQLTHFFSHWISFEPFSSSVS